MVPVRRLAVAVLILAAGLVSTSTASAGPCWDWLTHRECPSPTYSPLHYWTPAFTKLNADVHGPRISVYATNLHPEVPVTYAILQYKRRCPAADPAATLIDTPLPPPDSKAR